VPDRRTLLRGEHRPGAVLASPFISPVPMDLAFPSGLLLVVLVSGLRWQATVALTGSRECSSSRVTWYSPKRIIFD
jgi:hypothetical protein